MTFLPIRLETQATYETFDEAGYLIANPTFERLSTQVYLRRGAGSFRSSWI
jgi:hypothetical protein